jgi:hypothetical protein
MRCAACRCRRVSGTTAEIAGWPRAQYDGIVAFEACGHCERGPGEGLMKVVMLIAGIGCLLAGLLAIGFGIPVKEFSFGNTLILAGSVGACTGLVILALWAVVRELQGLAERLGPGLPLDGGRTELQPSMMPVTQRGQPTQNDDVPAGRDPSPAEQMGRAEPDFQSSQHELPPFPEPVEPPPPPKPRRNLMFSSSSRRERERAQGHAADQFAAHAAVAPPVPEASEPTLGSLDERPRDERARPAAAAPQRRGGRAPSTFDEPYERSAGESQPPVTVLKSGVVDGMAYSLYSDGSIEAQMPEGMMRFASIDELRAHLDQRP